MTYPPPLSGAQPPGQPPNPNPPNRTAAPAPKRRRVRLFITAAFAALLIAAGGGVGVFALRGIAVLQDSGVAMCEEVRDAQLKDIQTIDADTYHAIRKQFVDSRYPDLRDAGTRLIDLAWQVFGRTSGTETLGAALLAGDRIVQDYSSLVGACANHGVRIPDNLGS